MKQETDRAILATTRNAKAIQVVERKLEDIEQMLHKLESSVKERTPVP